MHNRTNGVERLPTEALTLACLLASYPVELHTNRLLASPFERQTATLQGEMNGP